MKDKGILLLTTFVALTAGCIGYGLGDGLVRYENITKALVGSDRLQWEVMLTGLAAIAGGYLAYHGATEPDKLARKQLATNHLIEFEKSISRLRIFENPDSPYYKFTKEDQYSEAALEKLTAALIEFAQNIPMTPPEINSQEASKLKENFADIEDVIPNLAHGEVVGFANYIVATANGYINEIKKTL
ncbi:hypothetical protein IT893_10160 [Thalassospira sp. A40-3]|uniref:hypothetical protein n=1 Tax=Thalassospira sp. A40-3 TaxID=2785908 RepID=UPI0018CE28E1|nr:hypothetical protein [Thalassospira sp. A40-3]QPO10166.1 hypothetical protein IT893_10160 [Thalassospira sp. A40-3]